MNEILSNLLYFGTGSVVGLYLGWMLRTMQYAKQARDAATKVLRRRDEHGWYKHNISLLIVLAFTATAAIWTGIVNVQLGHSKDCTEKVTSELVIALQERTSLSTDLSIADTAQNLAFRDLMVAVLTVPQQPPNKLRIIFQDYVDKLNTYLGLQEQQRQAQRQHPLPKEIDYKKCLEGA